ncbi:hypothetical protein QE152_g25569 [Popillia japonica]|uniref:Uncharacterized protein n=1 Tax=Popillia japonica TaxID=7064 RepID=A0AAW1K297_POPJA
MEILEQEIDFLEESSCRVSVCSEDVLDYVLSDDSDFEFRRRRFKMVRNESKSKLSLKKEFYDGFSMDSPPERLPPSTSKLTTTPSNMPGTSTSSTNKNYNKCDDKSRACVSKAKPSNKKISLRKVIKIRKSLLGPWYSRCSNFCNNNSKDDADP